MRNKNRLILVLVAALWICAIAFGLHKLWRYTAEAGVPANAPITWPGDSQIVPASDQPTLVLFAHPQCPCTRATIGELALLMAHCQGRVKTYVLFLKPKDFPVDWEKTDLWDKAAAIPGVTAVTDQNGDEAARFNAYTSGQTMLYSSSGSLLFSGGITVSRGHSGDNPGRSAIISLVNSGHADHTTTPSFGCSLQDPTSKCEEGAEVCDK